MNCSFASQPRPLTGGAYAKNLPLAGFLYAAALTAVSDQGPCPWTLVAFVTLCKFD